MVPGSQRPAEVVIERLAEQRVHELGPAGPARPDQAAALQCLERLIAIAMTQAGDLGRQVRAEPGAEYRRGARAGQARRWQAGETSEQQLPVQPGPLTFG